MKYPERSDHMLDWIFDNFEVSDDFYRAIIHLTNLCFMEARLDEREKLESWIKAKEADLEKRSYIYNE